MGGKRWLTQKALPVLGLGAVGGGWNEWGGEFIRIPPKLELVGALAPGRVSLVAFTKPSNSTFGVFALKTQLVGF